MGEASVPDRGGPDEFLGGQGTPEVLEGSAPSMTFVRNAAGWAQARLSSAWAWHRIAIMSSLGAALLIALVTMALTRPWEVRPGPFDPAVRVDVGLADLHQVDPYSLGDAGIVWAASYTVGGLDRTARYVLVGVSGPGLTDPMTVQLGPGAAWSAEQPVIQLGASLACTDPRLSNPTAVEYRAKVSRTDAFGRTATAFVPLGDSGAWRRTVLDQCLAHDLMFALQVTSGSARIVTHPRRVSVAIRIHNPLPYGIVLRASEPAIVAPGDPLDTDRIEIPAASTTSWTIGLAIGDCAVPSALERVNVEDEGTRVTRPALTVFSALAGDLAPADEYFNWLALPDQIARPVDRLLRYACAPARH